MNMRRGEFLPLVLFALLVVLFCMTRYADYDLWWHMKLGESLLATGGLYRLDTFSYTFAGHPQFTGEWLADLLIYLAYVAGGLLGVNLLKGTVLLGAFGFMYGALRDRTREEEQGFTAVILTLLVMLFALRFRLYVRPYIFSIFFLAVYLWCFSRYARTRDQRLLYVLPVLQVVWANLSVGAVFGPVVAGFFVIGEMAADRQRPFLHLPVLFLIAAATLVNPETYRIYTLALNLSGDPFKAFVGEYQPLTAQILWGYGLRYTLPFQILVVVATLYFVLCRGWRNLFHLLLVAFFLYETVQQVRMIELATLAAGLCAVMPVARLISPVARFLKGGARFIPVAVALVLVGVIPVSVVGNRTYVFGYGLKQDAFPDGALAFLDREHVAGRMFNSYSFGGYLIWTAPERKVFFDGRYARLYNPDFYRLYNDALSGADAWRTAAQRYGFDYALFEYDLKSRNFPRHLADNPDWALVYWDNHAVVYLKRTPANQPVIDHYEYRVTRPNFYNFSYLGRYREPAAVRAALSSVNREIALNPANQEPYLAKAFLLYQQGPAAYPTALEAVRAAMPLRPDLAMKHSALAFLLAEQGFAEQARAEISRALELDPFDAMAWDLGPRLGMKMKKPTRSPHG